MLREIELVEEFVFVICTSAISASGIAPRGNPRANAHETPFGSTRVESDENVVATSTRTSGNAKPPSIAVSTAETAKITIIQYESWRCS